MACADGNGPIQGYFPPVVSKEAANIFGWVEQCVTNLEPFTFVEDKIVRKYSKLSPICTKTLVKYLERLGKAVERKLRDLIPDTFGLVFDGWTMGSEHYIAIFLLWSRGEVAHSRLMCCGVQDDDPEVGETTFSAEDIGDYLFDELDILKRTDVRARVVAARRPNATPQQLADNPIEFITGDNTATNPKLAKLLMTKFKGCDAHKLALEVNEFIGPKPKLKRSRDGSLVPDEANLTERRKLVAKTDKLMVALGSLKNAGKLRLVSSKKPRRINGVRWSAQLGTMLREKELRDDLPTAAFPREVRELFLNHAEQVDADELVKDLKTFEKVNKALQGQGKTKETPRLTVAQSRQVLDRLIARFPGHTFTKINATSSLVTHPTWEKAIIKLQNNQEDSLTTAEKNEVKIYRLPDAPPEVEPADDDDGFDVGSILESQQREVASRSSKSHYRSTKHIFPTSVIVECLFSRAKLILSERRRSMSPWHMELLLFLHCNRDLWDEETVEECRADDFWSDDEDDPTVAEDDDD